MKPLTHLRVRTSEPTELPINLCHEHIRDYMRREPSTLLAETMEATVLQVKTFLHQNKTELRDLLQCSINAHQENLIFHDPRLDFLKKGLVHFSAILQEVDSMIMLEHLDARTQPQRLQLSCRIFAALDELPNWFREYAELLWWKLFHNHRGEAVRYAMLYRKQAKFEHFVFLF